jgi:hypothetical protein
VVRNTETKGQERWVGVVVWEGGWEGRRREDGDGVKEEEERRGGGRNNRAKKQSRQEESGSETRMSTTACTGPTATA